MIMIAEIFVGVAVLSVIGAVIFGAILTLKNT